MKIFKSFIISVLLILFCKISAYSFGFSNPKMSELDNSSVVSVTIRELDSNNIKYKKDSQKLLNPASSLKVFTFASILNTLGEDYNFETSIYKDNKGNIYIKLGADPLLDYSSLKALVKAGLEKGVFKKVSKIYIDDTIIDKKPYPNGWMTDDLWPNMPKLSPYTLNKNKVTIKIIPSRDLKTVDFFQDNAYKMALLNEVKVGEMNNLSVEKKYGDDNDIINIKGTINGNQSLILPVNNPKFYFIANLNEIFKDEKVNYKKEFFFSETPGDASKITSVSHSVKEVGQTILQNSDNFSSEIAFKVAGGVFNKTKNAATQDGIKMFVDYYNNLGFDTEIIKISDGSGVSRYNIFTTDWLSDVMVYLFKNTNIKNYMAMPNVGTLSRRLRFLDGRLWAKTGTLNGISSLTGLVINEHDKELVFSIIIQNFSEKTSLIKSFEDDLIDEIFKF